MSTSRRHIEAMLAAALATGVLANAEMPHSMRKPEPEPDIYSSRNDRRIAKRRAQKAARRKNRK